MKMSAISHQLHQTGEIIIPTFWERMQIPDAWRMDAEYRRKHAYTPQIGGLDIETSTAPDGSCAWMYLWCMAIDDTIVYGRTVDDLKQWIRRLSDALGLGVRYRMCIYIHNAKYDLSFLRRDISLASRRKRDFIARSVRQILRCAFDYTYEIRDSAVYTEMPLEMLGTEIGLEKLGADHSLIYTPDTLLPLELLQYCGRDAHILTVYYRQECAKYGGIGLIPLTATGRVRRVISSCFTAESKRWGRVGGGTSVLSAMIAKRQLKTKHTGRKESTPEQRQRIAEDRATMAMLRCAFFGGYCYCADAHVGNTYTDIAASADMDACYAWAMLTQRYPMDRFKPLPLPTSAADEMQLRYGTGVYSDYAMLIHVRIIGLKSRIKDMGVLPSWIRYTLRFDNLQKSKRGGRIMQADDLEIVLTDIDYRQLSRWYTVKNIQILDILGSRYGYLPAYITDTILLLYGQKKAAKAEIKHLKAENAATLQDEIAYSRKKTMLARLYGVFVQDPIRINYDYDEAAMAVVSRGVEQADSDLYDKVLYQWGVWVAAHARARLLDMIAKAGTRKNAAGVMEWTGSILYADTDCIRWLISGDDDPVAAMLAAENLQTRRQMQYICRQKRDEMRALYSVDIADDLLDQCGSWDIERYAIYKQIGLKQYAYVDADGNFKAVLAGLPKADYKMLDDGSMINRGMTFFDQWDDPADKIAALTPDLYIPAEKSHILRTRYVDDPHELDVMDCTGVMRHVSAPCGVVLDPAPYKAAPDLIDMLIEAEEEGLAFEAGKIGADFYAIAKEHGKHTDDRSGYGYAADEQVNT